MQMNFTNSKAGLFSGRWDPGRRGNSALGSTFEDLSPDNACCIFCVTLKQTDIYVIITASKRSQDREIHRLFETGSRCQGLGGKSTSPSLPPFLLKYVHYQLIVMRLGKGTSGSQCVSQIRRPTFYYFIKS